MPNSFLFFLYWGSNSQPHIYQAGTVPLSCISGPQIIFLYLFSFSLYSSPLQNYKLNIQLNYNQQYNRELYNSGMLTLLRYMCAFVMPFVKSLLTYQIHPGAQCWVQFIEEYLEDSIARKHKESFVLLGFDNISVSELLYFHSFNILGIQTWRNRMIELEKGA